MPPPTTMSPESPSKDSSNERDVSSSTEGGGRLPPEGGGLRWGGGLLRVSNALRCCCEAEYGAGRAFWGTGRLGGASSSSELSENEIDIESSGASRAVEEVVLRRIPFRFWRFRAVS